MGGAEQEISGVFFRAARDYIAGWHGDEALARVAEAAGPRGGAILRDPDTNAWYPEACFRDSLRAIRDVVADGHDERFEEIIRTSASLGIRQFMQIITRKTSPRELLQRAPSLWSMIRRGPARLRVESEPDRVLMYYERFPLVADPVYVPFFRGLVASMLEASIGYVPPMRVVAHGDDHLVIEVRLQA